VIGKALNKLKMTWPSRDFRDSGRTSYCDEAGAQGGACRGATAPLACIRLPAPRHLALSRLVNPPGAHCQRKGAPQNRLFRGKQTPHRSVLHVKSAAMDGRFWTRSKTQDFIPPHPIKGAAEQEVPHK